MTPSPIDPTSQPEVLRQLKALLDQGAITAAEYAILKHRAVAAPPAAPARPPAGPPVSAPAPAPPLPPPPVAAPSAAAPAAELPSLLDMYQQAPAAPTPLAPAPPPAAPAAPGEMPPPRLVPVAPVVVAPASATAAPSAPVPARAAEVTFLPVTPVPAAPPQVPSQVPPTVDFLPPVGPPVPVAPVLPPPVTATPVPAPAASLGGLAEAQRAPVPMEPVAVRAAAPEMAPAPDFQPVPSSKRPSRALPTLLLALGGLALLLLLGYLFLGPDQGDEHLTSRSRTAADSVAVGPETGPQAGPSASAPTPPAPEEDLSSPPVAAAAPPRDSVVRPAPAPKPVITEAEDAVFPSAPAPAKPVPTPQPAPAAATPPTEEPAAAPAASPQAGADDSAPAAAPEEGDDEATTRVRQALSSYYTDLQVPPFNARQHFAPVVERLYTRQNLTPAAIESELNQSMFPEFKQLSTTVVPGTLRVAPAAADGTRTVTYIERSRAFRVSRGKYQRTRTQVRVRFDPEYKMTYMRQEKLLENAFEE
ncbi:hypothetical protein [uncultured Hymenobacter sp.]|uniref:SHOCT domain-containing protein n=1 Tax=uncultured Hymenobacter sp. TaxID=170016 RepID=UPI0035CC5553